jgi:hypothetical protein
MFLLHHLLDDWQKEDNGYDMCNNSELQVVETTTKPPVVKVAVSLVA